MHFKSAQNYIKYIIAGFLTFIFFLFNMFFLQRSLDHDGVVYINNVRWVMIVKKPFFNPHHLHFEETGKHFHMLMEKNMGEHGFKNIVLNLRLRSLLIGCIGIFSFTILLIKITKKNIYGILGALLIGLTHGYLYNVAKVDTGIFALAWFSVTFWSYYELTTKKSALKFYISAIILGLSFFIGIMFHQYYMIFFIGVMLTFFIPERLFKIKLKQISFEIEKNKNENYYFSKMKNRVKGLLIVSLIAIILTGSAYFWVGLNFYGLPVEKGKKSKVDSLWKDLSFQRWIFAYKTNRRSSETWGDGLEKFNPKYVIRGITDSFLTQKSLLKYNKNINFDYDTKNLANLNTLAYNFLAGFFIIFFLMIFLLFFKALKKYKYIFISLLISFILFTILGVYWEPFYFEFWLIPTALMIIIFIMLLNLLGERLKILLGRLCHIPLYAFMFALIYIWFLHNLKFYIIPHSFNAPIEGLDLTPKEKYIGYLVLPFYKYPDNPYKFFINKNRR